jgi:hypothetical protein
MRGCLNPPNSVCSSPADYSVTATAGVPQVITFNHDMTNPIQLTFTWEYFGVCGAPASNNSGYCLLLKWKGVQLGNGSGGADFGTVRVRLCEEAITGSCKSG